MKKIVTKIISYVKGVFEEMRKVTWPSRKATVRYSVLVIGVSVFVAAFFAILDFIFNLGLEGLIKISS